MGGDCEGVKGATADIRLFPLPAVLAYLVPC